MREHAREPKSDPIFVSVEEAARLLGLSKGGLGHLLDEHVIESRYSGRRRLVPLASVRAYAEGLPTESPARHHHADAASSDE